MPSSLDSALCRSFDRKFFDSNSQEQIWMGGNPEGVLVASAA